MYFQQSALCGSQFPHKLPPYLKTSDEQAWSFSPRKKFKNELVTGVE